MMMSPLREIFNSILMKRVDNVMMPDANTQPYGVSSPFNLPPYDSLPPIPLPQNAPPFCVYPPFITTQPPPIQNPPTPSSPAIIVPIPNPPPPPPTASINLPPVPPSPPISYFNPSPPPPPPPPPPVAGRGAGPSPPTSYIPKPPMGFVPSPVPVFLPPVVYPPPAVPPPPYLAPAMALWCVAKPSVPDPIVQEAMNYACASGADCDQIQPSGSCFQPNTLLAHASYAFNSYWQRTKVAGGTCEFGGIAMLVTVDPSYDGCHFIYF